jgi:hypothetical protein
MLNCDLWIGKSASIQTGYRVRPHQGALESSPASLEVLPGVRAALQRGRGRIRYLNISRQFTGVPPPVSGGIRGL